jgi:hypothetical protein
VRKRLGLISFLIGAMSLCVGATAGYARGARLPGSSAVLDFFATNGLVREYRRDVVIPIASESGMFSITDEKAVLALAVLAILMSGAAMVLALVAEHRRERTLYLSAGYTCAALALIFLRPLYTMIAMVAGIVIVMVMRHGRNQPDT